MRRFLASFATALALGPGLAAAASLPVVLDGAFPEWRQLAPVSQDAQGDGAPQGLDFGRMWLADDGEALYLRLEVGRETILQNPSAEPAGSELRLWVDLDAAADTGLPTQGIGAEIEVRFGERRVVFYDRDGVGESVNGGRAGVVGLPTHSAAAFELRLPLPDGPATGEILVVAAEETAGGDRLPDLGAVAYLVSDRVLGPPRPIDLDRRKRTDFRLYVHNISDTLIGRLPKLATRLLKAVSPDLVVLQEVADRTPGETRDFVAAALPRTDGRQWVAAGTADVVTVSAFPILATAAVDGNLAVHVDLPGDTDLVVINVHLPCCGNETARDRESDNAAALWRDLLAGAGPFPIGPDDAVIYAGDFNFVGFRRQVEAIRDGRFIDPGHGPDFQPGRGSGSLAVAPLRHVAGRTRVTWRNPSSAFAPGRLDWVFFSGDRLRHRRSYVLDTPELPRPDRKAAGLRRRDTDRASDHLPLVVDFRLR